MSVWEKPSKVFGAYHAGFDWLNLASIRATEDGVRKWIKETYISGRSEWVIVPVVVNIDSFKKLAA